MPVQNKPFVTVRTGPGVSMRNGREKEVNRGGARERVRVQEGERGRARELKDSLLFGSPVANRATLDSRAATASAVSSAQ